MPNDLRDDRIRVLRMLHTIHAVRDTGATRKLYQDVLGGIAFAERYHQGEDRDMALLYVADHMVEPMSPRRPDAPDTTFARYLSKFGEGFHSFEVRIDDAVRAAEICRRRDYALSTVYPKFFFVRPESTGGILVELCGKPLVNDPKDYRGWRDDWISGHPSGLLRLRHIACVVRDTRPTLDFLTNVLDGSVIETGPLAAVQPSQQTRLLLGDTAVAIVTPDDPVAGPLGQYLSQPCSGIYALVWQVEDIDRAHRYFEELGMPTTAAHVTPGGFAIDPGAMFGARHEFVAAA